MWCHLSMKVPTNGGTVSAELAKNRGFSPESLIPVSLGLACLVRVSRVFGRVLTGLNSIICAHLYSKVLHCLPGSQ